MDTYQVDSNNYRSAYAVKIPCDAPEGKKFEFDNGSETFMRIVQGASNAQLDQWQRRVDIELAVSYINDE